MRSRKGGISAGGCLIAIILAIILIAIGYFLFRTTMDKVISDAADYDNLIPLVQEIAEANGYDLTEEQIRETLDKIPEEKIERVQEIAKKHATPEVISKVSELAQSGDTQAVQEYLLKELDYTELQDLYELYDEYLG